MMTQQSEKQTLRKILTDLAPKAQQLLADMITYPSTHGRESELQTYLEKKWTEAGFEIERHSIPDNITSDPEYSNPEKPIDFKNRDNLMVRVKGKDGGRSVILNSHVDVVPPHLWPEAFQPKIDGDMIYGRGACDAKGCVATMFLAACALRERKRAHGGDVIYQMVVDEEVGGNGSLALIREGIRADGVVVLEPTKLMLHPANRGAIWFRFEFAGKSTHMGRKEEGINAIDLAYETIGILYEYEKQLAADREAQPLFASYPLPTQVNIGILHGGEWPSMVAGSAVMEGGVGFLPNRPMSRVKTDMVHLIEERGSDALRSRYQLTFPRLHNDSYETPVNDPLVKTFHAAIRETDAQEKIMGWNVSCDARLFARIGGMPTIVFGPGDIQDAHSAEEKIRVSEMVTAAETLIRFIDKWCNGYS